MNPREALAGWPNGRTPSWNFAFTEAWPPGILCRGDPASGRRFPTCIQSGAFAVISLVKRLAVLVAFLLVAPGAALAGQYLPLSPTDVAAADKAVVAAPAPVQLLFQFKTKGAPNPQATKFLNDAVAKHVRESGVFSEVTTGPAANGAVLSITLENIPQEGAAGKGFATGLTFGLAGSTVIDYYICTVEFIPGPGAAKVTKEIKHQIITTLGLTKAPENTVKTKGINDAVLTMTRHVVTNGVNDVAKDPGFTLAAAVPAPPAEAAPVAEPAAAPGAPETATAPTGGR